MTIYGYARVSDKSMQIESQVQQLKEFGCEKIIQEKITGIAEEKKLNKLIKEMEEESTLVVTRMDRLGRSTKQLIDLSEELRERKIKLILLDVFVDINTAQGKAFLTIMSAFSELERSVLKEKQRRGIAYAKSIGTRLGRRPKYSKQQLNAAISDYVEGKKIITEITEERGVSRASLYRELERRGVSR
jgi:DNA invertase Pin-like site-specific DNA recombinase